jgi:hypothetical protein
MGGAMGKMGGSLFGTQTPSDFHDFDAATGKPMTVTSYTPASVIGGLSKLAGGASPQQQQGQQPAAAQPVAFNAPNMPYIPPPVMQNPYAQRNPMYGG